MDGNEIVTYQPFFVEGETRPGHWCVSCDHASNTVPPFVNGGDLGLSQHDMNRHIAWDVGAAGVAKRLGEVLNSPVILSNFSRLVIDPNRGLDDPTLLMRLYDGSIVPANRHLTEAQREDRVRHCYLPYHDALGRMAARPGAALLSIHSYTPQLVGKPMRPWHVGILYAGDDRIARPLMDRLAEEPDITVGDNEPYSGHLRGDAVDKHAIQQGRPNVLIELRNDLIADAEGQKYWAERLAPMLEDAWARANL